MRFFALGLVSLVLSVPLAAQISDIRFGNLHSHTSYSDGLGKPSDAYTMACDAGLDFFAITEHNHDKGDGKGERKDDIIIATHPDLYEGDPEALVQSANALNRPDQCVTIYGQEFSTISKGNHVNIFDVDEVIDVENGRFDLLLDWLDQNPDGGSAKPLIQFNHPNSGKKAVVDYGRDDFGGADELAWQQAMSPRVSLIEVFNAPALRDGEDQRTHERSFIYRLYLNLGFHVAPSVGQDNHFRNWGKSTDARVAVIAPDFTRRGIIEALRRRHAYASDDKNLRAIFRAGDALQGDIVPPPDLGAELPLTLQIKDEDEPNAIYRVDVYKDVAGGKPARNPVESFEFSGDQISPVALEGIRFEEVGEYVLLRITQFSDEVAGDEEHPIDDQLWTAPIWFETDHFHHDAEDLPRLRMTALLPNPVGDDLVGERISFRNLGSEVIDLAGWQVRDLAGNIWELEGLDELAAGEEKSLLRDRQPMALNNNGDRVELVAPDGAVVQVFAYEAAGESEELLVPEAGG